MILVLLAYPQGDFRSSRGGQGMSARIQFFAIIVLGLAFLYIFRETGPTNYQIGVLMRCMILMIVTIGLNILIGHAGLVSLGQAALYGLGAYVAAWLAVKHGVPFLPACACGVIATALMGAVLAYPTVRVRGVHLAVITIAFGLVFENILEGMAECHRRHAGPDRNPARQRVRHIADSADLLLGGCGLSRVRVRRPVQHHFFTIWPRHARYIAK